MQNKCMCKKIGHSISLVKTDPYPDPDVTDDCISMKQAVLHKD